jgi:hypothetical protein
MSRDAPVPCRSSAASASWSNVRDRDVVLGLPDNPMTDADTCPPETVIGRDSKRGVAADLGALVRGFRPPAISSHCRAPDRPLSGQHMEQQTWQHIGIMRDVMARNLEESPGLCNHGIHR